MINLGGVVYEAGNTVKNKTGSWRTFRPEVDRDKCVGCRLCETYCPDGAIVVENGKAKVDLDYCKGCGICANECPVKAIKMVEEVK